MVPFLSSSAVTRARPRSALRSHASRVQRARGGGGRAAERQPLTDLIEDLVEVGLVVELMLLHDARHKLLPVHLSIAVDIQVRQVHRRLVRAHLTLQHLRRRWGPTAAQSDASGFQRRTSVRAVATRPAQGAGVRGQSAKARGLPLWSRAGVTTRSVADYRARARARSGRGCRRHLPKLLDGDGTDAVGVEGLEVVAKLVELGAREMGGHLVSDRLLEAVHVGIPLDRLGHRLVRWVL